MGVFDVNIGDIGDLLVKAREAITGKGIDDPVKRAEISLKLEQLEQAINLGQIEINKEEAKNPNLFVAGARPFILWVCGIAVAYHFILSPFLFSILGMFGIDYKIPQIDVGVLFNLMMSMLGLAGLRTYEKLKGVNGRHE